MLDKSLDSLTESDIQQVVADRLQEDKQLEYKEALPGNDHEGKKEFLADVSAMANAAGGLILYGIAEERDSNKKASGIPAGIPGLHGINLDQEIRRLDNLLRDGVKPRIQGVGFQPVPLSDGDHILAVQVPRSWNVPHVVELNGHWRFYVRNSSGKHPMDLDETRTAMTFADTVTERVRGFRLDRLGRIVAGEIPVPLRDGGKIVLHLLPLSMVAHEARIDPAQVDASRVRPIEASS